MRIVPRWYVVAGAHPITVRATGPRQATMTCSMRQSCRHILSIPTLPYPDLRLPPRLDGLARLAYNLYWTWHPEVRALFARIDRQHWAGYRSPVAVLQAPLAWSELLDDTDFMARYTTILEQFDAYMANGRAHWFARHHGD